METEPQAHLQHTHSRQGLPPGVGCPPVSIPFGVKLPPLSNPHLLGGIGRGCVVLSHWPKSSEWTPGVEGSGKRGGAKSAKLREAPRVQITLCDVDSWGAKGRSLVLRASRPCCCRAKASVLMSLIRSQQNPHVEVPAPGACSWDLIWKWSQCRSNQVSWGELE